MATTLILNQDLGAGSVDNAAVGDDAITTVKITDGNITLAKMASASVDSDNIVDASIVSGDINAAAGILGTQLANDTISATQIAANAVTASELSNDAVDTAAILDDAVTTAKIGDGEVTIAKIGPLNSTQIILGNGSAIPTATTVTGDVTISNLGVTGIGNLKVLTGMIADLNVTTAKIANSNVTIGKMANDSVNSAQILANAVGSSELDLTAGYALTGNVSFTQQVVIPAIPTGDTDAASKGYVDGLVEGLTWKKSVRVNSLSNITISGPGAAIDGVTMVAADRVLLSAQTTGAEEGLYVFNGAAAAMTRTADGDTFEDLDHAAVFVEEGTSADEGFTQTVALSGFGGQIWVQFSGAGNIVAGTGLTKTGNTINMGTFTGVTLNADTAAVDYGASGDIKTLVPDASQGAGVAVSAARADHSHAIAAATAVDVGTANAEGNSTSFARANHVHALGAGSVANSNLFVAGVVDSNAIAANAVTSSELADNAVDTAAILDLNVTLGKLAVSSVNSSKIVDASIMLVDLNAEVTNAMSGYTNRVTITVASDGDTVFNVGSGTACPLTTPGNLVYVNGRLMELGAGLDYTMADNGGQHQITFLTGRFTDDVISVVFDAS